jgi:hypothetical protein
MYQRLGASILAAFLMLEPSAAPAETPSTAPKMAPLAEVTGATGLIVVFDATKISAIYVAPFPDKLPFHLKPNDPALPEPVNTTFIQGIGGSGNGFLAIKEIPIAVLNRLKLADKFITVTNASGDTVWLKASAIVSLRAPISGEPGVDPTVKTLVSVGSETFQIMEDAPTIRKLVDDIRIKQDVEH